MMEAVRQWLVGVACAAMIVALADALTPSGTVKKLGRLAGGLVLTVALVSPLLSLDYGALAGSLAHYRASAAVEGVTVDQTELMKSIIGEETGAYILDKAEELGLTVARVVVTCEVGENQVPYPTAVTVVGTWTQSQQAALARRIEADLAIPAQRQTYESGETEE